MTSVFPHPPYAEDQPSSHAILYLHVIRATTMTTSFASLITAPSSLLLSRYLHSTPLTLSALTPRIFAHSSRSLVLGSAAGIAVTWGHMRGREEIEWQDRAWRLLENEGEKGTDWWVLGSAAVGAMGGFVGVRRGRVPVGLGTGVLGGAGLGMGTGVSYMVGSFVGGRKPV